MSSSMVSASLNLKISGIFRSQRKKTGLLLVFNFSSIVKVIKPSTDFVIIVSSIQVMFLDSPLNSGHFWFLKFGNPFSHSKVRKIFEWLNGFFSICLETAT